MSAQYAITFIAGRAIWSIALPVVTHALAISERRWSPVIDSEYRTQPGPVL